MPHSQNYDNASVCLETQSVTVNATGTVGLQVPVYAGNNTRYLRVDSRYLKEWAGMVEELAGENKEVVVGLTPDKPMFAKRRKDDSLAVVVAPRVENSPESSE